ncbi:MAG: hypothetical protein LBS36_12210 [Oscillospiraceae bacterium]|nr:hypothetical protein [Oscillospiraceae bacterium]
MDPFELTLSVTALANALAGTMSDNELNLASAVLTQLGDTLATISVQRSIASRQPATPPAPSAPAEEPESVVVV